jgi:hypothetical protein
MATFCAISRAEKKSTKKQVTRKQPEKKETNQPRLTEVIRNGHGAIFLFPILRRKERSECKEESVLCSLPVITTVIIAVVLLVFFFFRHFALFGLCVSTGLLRQRWRGGRREDTDFAYVSYTTLL